MEEDVKKLVDNLRKTLKPLIQQLLYDHPEGLTAEEIGEHLGRDRQGVHPRIRELEKAKIVFKTGEKRISKVTKVHVNVYKHVAYMEGAA